MAEENYGALTGLNLDDPQYQGMRSNYLQCI
jgi:hypothetical protein